jgi:glycosyltransferase involved in cell wall biosynthesis
MSKLTFIIPVYRKEHILERNIKALIAQSLKDWDIVFVLDGPSLEAKEIIIRTMKKQPQDYKIIEIEHGGACRARNEGFKYSTGDYVIFWDADCIIEPHIAKAWIDIFEQNSQVGFIYASYSFFNEKGAILAEPFDPWLLKIRNYISTCFPLRRTLVPQWNEGLKSLQDWDFWLSVVEKGGVGKCLEGYSWSTEFPDKDSISGNGCGPLVWLERVEAVQKLHNIISREICVSSLSYKADGIALAKLIDANYQDYPNDKPNRYKKIIQVGFSLKPDKVEMHANAFSNPETKNYLFWMPDNIHEVWNEISFSAINKYSILLNGCSTQFVEDKIAKDRMTQAGFKVEILPMPMINDIPIQDLPKIPRFAVDCGVDYGKIFSIIDKSLPDIDLEVLLGGHRIEDYTGLVHFFNDRTLSNGIKRMILTGKHVISNVQDPHTGFIDDNKSPEKFIEDFVDKIRKIAYKPVNQRAIEYYKHELNPARLLEAIK